jgi:uncharacterized cupredoxin-like copper-binding protein
MSDTTARPEGRSVAMLLVTGALILQSLVLLVVFIQFFVPPEAIDPFFFIFLLFVVTFVALAGLGLWRPRPWVYLVGGIALLLFLLLNAGFIIGLLFRPVGAPEELPWAGLLADIVAPVGFVAGIVAFRQGRLGTWTPASAAGRTPLLAAGFAGLLLGVFYVSFVGSLGLSASGGTGVRNGIQEPPSQEPITVGAEDLEWSTSTLEARAGVIPVYVVNRDDFPHTFDVEIGEKHLSYPVAPASTTVALIEAEQAGEYRFYCAVPGHEAMKGTLRVA